MKGHKLSRVFPVTVALLAMLVLMVPAPVHAAETVVSIPEPDATVGPGEEVTLPINITDITDVGAINIWLSYNSSIVTIPDGGIAAGDMGDLAASSIDNTNGIAKMVWFDPEGENGSFVFANVTFKAGTTSGSCPLDIQVQELVDTYNNPIPYTEDDGVFAVDATPTPTPTPTPGPTGGGGGGGGALPTPKLKVDMMGKVASVSMTKGGILKKILEVTCPDETVTLCFPEGTRALDSEGDCLEKITVDAVPDAPEAPEGSHIIGLAYDFGPDGAIFEPRIELTVEYDPEALHEGVNEEELVIAYHDSESWEWRLLPSVVDTGAHTVTISIGHFTVFAILGMVLPPEFTLSNLLISPAEISAGESLSISVLVANNGGSTGSRTVELLIAGELEATEEISLTPGASDTVTFTATRDIAGTYVLEIDGLTDEFTVIAPFPWVLVGGIIGSVLGLLAATAIAVYLLIFRRRRAPA